jgi:predicted SnoaL-like aldol condensation-catalyzing enzyme
VANKPCRGRRGALHDNARTLTPKEPLMPRVPLKPVVSRFASARACALAAVALATVVGTARAQPRPDGPLDAVTVASPEALARNKRNVVEFYDLAFNQSKPREAVERYVGDVYKEHSPDVPDGKDGLIWHFENLAREYSGKKLAIKRAIAEGNHVVVHRWTKLPSLLGETESMAIDIFRLDDNGRIVEHWDVQQRIPRSSTNRNSIF